jgi:hypothetical protein
MDGLMVSTAVRVIDGIHRHTADGWVEFASRLSAIMCCTGLHQRLLGTTVAGENTDGCSTLCGEILQISTRQPNADLVAHSSLKHGVVTARAGELAAVSGSTLDIADCRSFWNLSQCGHVAWSKADLLTKRNLLSDEHPFCRSNVARGSIFELQFGQWSSVNWTVNHLDDFTLFLILAWKAVCTREPVATNAILW